jgi:ATP-dependent Clp protease ATP-binding subunit ClpB
VIVVVFIGMLLLSCRFLPDKAIDLIDEAAAKLKMEITSKPEALDEMDRKVLQLEMERLSLQKVRGAVYFQSYSNVQGLLQVVYCSWRPSVCRRR